MGDFYPKNYERKPDQIIFLHGHDGPSASIQPAQQKNETYPLSDPNYNVPPGMPLPQPGSSSQAPHIGFVNPSYPGMTPHLPPLQPQPSAYNRGQYIDPEDPLGPEVKGFEFSDETIRKGFIRKVYSILTIQLTVTLGFIFLIGYEKNTRQWAHEHPAMFFCAIGVMFITLLVMACIEQARRRAPLNFIVLGVFTISQSYIVAMATFRFSKDDVLLAIGVTAAVCLALTIFAFQTKWDFTMMGGVLFVAVILLMLFGLVAIFVQGKVVTLIYSSLGALIFSVYLIYDTQMMMGGTHKYSISPEEYIFGALTLYLDIINIFLYILQIIGAARD